MGSDYITRRVFHFHALPVMFFHNREIKGALCGRIFTQQLFIEIVFLAVHFSFQPGRSLINYLKAIIQTQELFVSLTCADNEAVGFIRKLPFNHKGIFMDPKRSIGRIKDSDKITLMHCHIYPEIDSMNFQKAVDRQMGFL
jgi:histone acetyltransferase